MNDSAETLLIVDDAIDWLKGLKRLIEPELACQVFLANSAIQALQLMAEHKISIVLTDIRMPDVDGMELMERTQSLYPETSVILMTAYGSINQAVEALKKGAYDFVTKPLDERRLFHALRNCLERQRIMHRAASLEERLAEEENLALIQGKSPALQKVLATIRQIAKTDLSVLITGESGSGKELAANTIHALSKRSKKRMVAVNCPAIPEALLESELFGYRKGAFTHATQDKKGLIEIAQGSTLFLDEIGDLPKMLQTKLLRVLQEREIRPLGDNRTRSVDVRVISSTNRNLQEKIAQGEFREDLYYRINVVSIRMPSLTEIREDIPTLAVHFLNQYLRESGLPPKILSPEAICALMEASWKGNARQLQNAVKRAAAFAPGEVVRPEHFELEGTAAPFLHNRGMTLCEMPYHSAREEILKDFTTRYITDLLVRTKGSVSTAAHLSGLERQSLQHLMRKYGIRSERFREGH
ncbi:MAG: sigma-54 dependent transcriptional regulator [Syntrophobacteraceae bacterium]|nr:sigma-54 dependent transcriptional regulator [Desulfobacteraceae bacterium]